MPFARVDDITIHYDLAGPAAAPVLMLANSLGTNFHMWDAQVAALTSRFRLLRYDKRGHGLSDCSPVGAAGYPIDRLADDALGLLGVLGIDTFHFCGLSIGGMIGQKVAAKAGKRLQSLVLCDTGSRIGPPGMWDERIAKIRAGGLEVLADGILTRWFTPHFLTARADEARGYRNMVVRTPADGYIGCSLGIRNADLRPEAASIAVPTLIVVGAEDAATPVSSARELHDAITGSELVIIEAAGHIPAIEQVAILNEALTGFFARQLGDR
jgi:3-oxoadipate enol-lactonase